MPLSNEETNELITQLKNKLCCPSNFAEKECIIEVEKIIKRFANKPGKLYLNFFFKESDGHYARGSCDMGFNEKSNDYYISLPGRCNNETMIFEHSQLEILRDNCNWMLNYNE